VLSPEVLWLKQTPLWLYVTKLNSYLKEINCIDLKGVGTKTASLLKKLGITTAQDLLFHLPSRYEDRTVLKTLNNVQLGEQVLVEGDIVQAAIESGRRKRLKLRIEDATGFLSIYFFHFTPTQVKLLSVGRRVQCYGEVKGGILGNEMVHPEYSLLKDGQNFIPPNSLTPIYPTTEGLHQYALRKIVAQVLQLLRENKYNLECLPESLLEKFNLQTIEAAIFYVHTPPVGADLVLLQQGLHPAQQRLIFEELLAYQLSLARIKLKNKDYQAPVINFDIDLKNKFLGQLNFQLTSAQQRVIDEILADLCAGIPMLRLVQGDVGSGKTIVAAMAAFCTIASGFQAAIMAPTEILAEQHFKNFAAWVKNLNVNIACLTSTTPTKIKNQIIQDLIEHKVQLIIGTHALFQKKINFANLGLIIIDEQHRFGVNQRLEFLNKGANVNLLPHQLIMSATPIPRTLAMSAYADLNVSTIDELPPGRTPVNTIALSSTKRDELIARIKNKCQAGCQVYWVCTLISESEFLQCQAAEEVAEELKKLLPEIHINLIHGRLKSIEKEKIMNDFKAGAIDLLVATTVIEVGVDVPNASLMIIENPERLGLAQLHQLRGRVGRGHLQSHCVLLCQYPLSKIATERMAVMRESNDGFFIAQRDLELRGPGEVLGTRQTGLLQFRIANLIRDSYLLPLIQTAANMMLQDWLGNVEPLVKRWIAEKEQFSEV
jgi:ATP-dependent DNA helicase RecG